MDIKAAAKWSVALRSGEYKQCRRTMCRFDRHEFCCLGVAAQVLVRGGCSGTNYTEIRKALGIDGPTCGGLMWKFVDMNDDQGKSFSEIADYIDELIAAQSTSAGGE